MSTEEQFDAIRPYNDQEFRKELNDLLSDQEFISAIDSSIGVLPRKILFHRARQTGNATELQRRVIVPLILLTTRCHGGKLSHDFTSLPSAKGNWLFISNHRDIVMDSAFLDCLLIDEGADGVEIAIGDNLLIKPWIERLVRLNKSFIVHRSLPPSEFIESSRTLSAYISHAINEKMASVWIAQREGRAKDSNDLTQKSLLKMLAMSGDGDAISTLAGLHLVPLAISYEYDPCDWLKAKEFQLKRDNPDYRKTRQDDLQNMRCGIFGKKGHIHYQAAGCIDDRLMSTNHSRPRNVLLEEAAGIIDNEIHRSYRIYPGNRVALDLLSGEHSQESLYTAKERETFERYMERQLSKIDIAGPDWSFLRTKFLEMYANPLINQLKSVQ